MNVRDIGSRPNDLGTRVDATPKSMRVTALEPSPLAAPLVAFNTRTVGIGGLLLTVGAAVYIGLQQQPVAPSGHPSSWFPAVLAVIGSVGSLLGRWRTFYE